MADPYSFGLTEALERNIAALAERRRVEREREPLPARVADAVTRFIGNMTFVSLHAAVVAFWIAANIGVLPGVPRFDPTFVTLATAASVEALFLSAFVLISQNRMQAEADRRADLDLHINLLAEHELTKLASVVVAIAEKLGVETHKADDVQEIEKDIDPERVLDELEARQG